MPEFAELKSEYTNLWDNMEITNHELVNESAEEGIKGKERYQAVEKIARVPWPVIAAAHMREATFDWDTYLGNGEKLNRKTRLVPRGRGPFKTWEAGAIDAMRYDDLDDIMAEDWTIEGAAYALEKLNGFGYRRKKINTPYLWAASNNYTKGKFVSDGKWRASAQDKQCGCMPMLKRMMELDPSIRFPPALPEPEAPVSIDVLFKIQDRLAAIGLLDPPSDGIIGSVTRWALHATGIKHEDITSDNAEEILEELSTVAALPLNPKDDLAGRIVTAAQQKGYFINRHRDCYNIVYIEGMDENGKPNANKPNEFNDLRIVVQVVAGVPKIVGQWQATTEPSKYWTLRPMNSKGAARIAFGQWKAWTVGIHNGSHEALIQITPLTVWRDKNKDFSRDNDEQDTGLFGINQHWGYDKPKNDIGKAGAGCLIGRMKAGHREFMKIIKQDARYKAAGGGYRFMSIIMPAQWVLPT